MALTVLQIVPAMTVGGVETGTLDLGLELVRRGHKAIVVSSGGPLVAQLEAGGVIHYTLPVEKKLPWTILDMSKKVAELIETHEVDVIHARSRVPAMIGFLARRRVARRVSFRMGGRHRVPSFITTAHGYYSKHLFSGIMGWGQRVIAISDRIARHMIDSFGVPPERIRLIPRGVDLSLYAWRSPRLEAPKGEWRVSVVGRITPIKGHRDLIRAFAVVTKQFPKATLRVAGGAPPRYQKYLGELKTLAAQLGIQDRVEFIGHEPDVAGHLAQSDLLVLPSTGQEAFGRVLIEAGASGVPVVATQVGGVAEVVLDRKTGLLVPPGEPMTMAHAIITLLKDRKLAAEMSEAARRRVESLFPMERMVEQTLDVYQEVTERLKILVIKLSAIGDIVLVTPSLRALRARFPKAHITVLVGREGRDLLNRCPYVDDMVVFDRGRDGDLGGIWSMGRRLRLGSYDIVVDFQNSRISHWLGFLSAAPQRYGYDGRRWSFLLTHRAKNPDRALPPVRHQFHLLDLLGIQGASEHLELWPGPQDESRARELLQGTWVADQQPLIAVHPGSQWVSKRWPADRYAKLIDELASSAKARVVLTGSASEKELADQIYRAARIKPIMAAGATSLNELAALLRSCRAFVGGDTAALHVAAAAGTPVIAIFGPTDPARHLPPAAKAQVLRAGLPCSPCYNSACRRRGAGYMECMTAISVDEVLKSVKKQL